MFRRADWRAALAAMGAAAGTAFASGRELTLFFAQLGWASWAGAAVASLAFGAMAGVTVRCAQGGGERGLAGACRRLGMRIGSVPGLARALLLALTAAVTLLGAGKLGALTLPLRHAFLWGAGVALLVALLMNLGGLRALPWLGLVALVVGMAFHAGLAIDPRPVRTMLRADAELALAGSLPAAAVLGLLFAGLNAAVAGDALARFSGGCDSAARTGALCGALMAAALACANAALARGGRALLGQALLMALLSARWGLWGFWLCAGFGWLCCLCTLSAALGGLIDLFRDVKC